MNTVKINRLQKLLYFVFGLVPIVAGLDKFFNLLTNWKLYLNGMVTDILPISPDVFMRTVGVIEIVAGVIVLLKPRIGALIVSLWLVLIALNLILMGKFLDVAVRDIVVAISAYTFWQLTLLKESSKA